MMKKEIGGQFYYSNELLVMAGIPRETIRHWSKNQGGVVDSLELEGMRWYRYDTIPTTSRRKIAAHEGASLAGELWRAVEEGWKEFVHIYRDEPSRRDKAARHALAERCRQLTGEGHAKNEVFQACQQAGLCKDWRTFGRLLQAERLTHQGKGNTNAAKLTAHHRQLIEHHYARPNKFSTQAVADKTNADLRADGLEPVSYDSVKKYLQNPEIRTKYAALREGSNFVNNKVASHIKFNDVELVGRLAQMDGLSVPLLYMENGQQRRPVLFAVLDAASRKITGWTVGKSENRWLVSNALRDHAAKTGWLPMQIMADNFGAKKTVEHGGLEERLLSHGCQMAYHRPNDPQGKPHIERAFGTLQDRFMREYPGFLGMGIRSKAQGSSRNNDAYAAHVKQNGLPTFGEVTRMIGQAIEAYNAHSFGGRPSPDTLFGTLPRADVKAVETFEIPVLFWHKTRLKANRGWLTLTVDKAEYNYPLHVQHNGKPLEVHYDPDDLSEVAVMLDGKHVTLEQDSGLDRFDLPAIGQRQTAMDSDMAFLCLTAPELTRKADLAEAENHFDTKGLGVYTDSIDPAQSMDEFYRSLNLAAPDDGE